MHPDLWTSARLAYEIPPTRTINVLWSDDLFMGERVCKRFNDVAIVKLYLSAFFTQFLSTVWRYALLKTLRITSLDTGHVAHECLLYEIINY